MERSAQFGNLGNLVAARQPVFLRPAAARAEPVTAAGSRINASLQHVGPLPGEELLLSTALRIEAAMAG